MLSVITYLLLICHSRISTKSLCCSGLRSADQSSIHLRGDKCPLHKLILKHANVDDFECKQFVETHNNNRLLREIDSSSNTIGESLAQDGNGNYVIHPSLT